MSDLWLAVGQSPRARAIVRRLGLPLPLPVALRRERGAWPARPLADRRVVVGSAGGGPLLGMVAACLAEAGADAYLTSPETQAASFAGPGEIFGRPARPLGALAPETRIDALVFDASAADDLARLREIYAFAHPLVGRMARSGRFVVLSRAGREAGEAGEAAVHAALEGFVRSVAKEVGRGGATANLLAVEPDAGPRAAPALRFLLSPSSAFVTGQPIVVSSRARPFAEPSFVRPLEKRTALVTGAARGIGAATARALAREGARVVCLDRPADAGPLSQLAREVGGSALGVDLSHDDAHQEVERAVRAIGGLDVLVHNAGITRDKTLARMSADQWDQVLGVNLGAVLRTTAALEPHLRDHGRIVCLSSVSGIAGNAGQAAYAASKAGIMGLVRTWAGRFAERGITVNAVAPGFIETRMTAAMPVAVREAARRLSALGQGGLPEDVAEVILFLASPGAHGVTGRTLRVCGGALVGA